MANSTRNCASCGTQVLVQKAFCPQCGATMMQEKAAEKAGEATPQFLKTMLYRPPKNVSPLGPKIPAPASKEVAAAPRIVTPEPKHVAPAPKAVAPEAAPPVPSPPHLPVAPKPGIAPQAFPQPPPVAPVAAAPPLVQGNGHSAWLYFLMGVAVALIAAVVVALLVMLVWFAND